MIIPVDVKRGVRLENYVFERVLSPVYIGHHLTSPISGAKMARV